MGVIEFSLKVPLESSISLQLHCSIAVKTKLIGYFIEFSKFNLKSKNIFE